MHVYLVHHGEAVTPDVDIRLPLSPAGLAHVEALAAAAASRGVKPAVVWHSGKLRAKQTAEAFWRACNPLATLSATRDVQPADQPLWMRDRLRHEAHDILIAGHFPHLPRLLSLLLSGGDEGLTTFPLHGIVALETVDAGETWREVWRSDHSTTPATRDETS
jgi:phosphohistidine phosphatase